MFPSTVGTVATGTYVGKIGTGTVPCVGKVGTVRYLGDCLEVRLSALEQLAGLLGQFLQEVQRTRPVADPATQTR